VSKSTVTRTFLGSLVAFAGGLVLLGIAAGVAYANGAFVMQGPDVVGVQSIPGGWALVLLAVVGGVAMIGAVVGQFVAWIGALINTSQLQEKTWFVVLLVCGLLGFGFIAMVIYLVAGPPDPQPSAAMPPIPRPAESGHTSVA
jgi:hypothetical protein